MKKVLAILLMLCILAGLPFSAYADQEELDPDYDWTEEEPEYPEEEPEQEPTDPPEEEPGEEPEPPAQEDPYAYELVLPDKRFYLVGEEPDFTGGEWIYTTSNRRIPLTSRNCTGLDTSTPGNKYVRVMVGKEKVYFRVVVLDRANPIVQMKDIADSHWGYEAFSLCMKAGYFAGTPEKNINPDAPITRAEMATLIYEAWKKDPSIMVKNHPEAAAPFVDVAKTDWYYQAVDACRKAGIIQGNEQGECMPNQPITRQDAVLMLMRIQYGEERLAQLDILSLLATSGVPVVDFETTADYAKAAVAVALGTVIRGNEKGEIMPRASITRASCAVIFKQLFFQGYTPIADDQAPLIYLSPSNQFANSYTGVNTTEGAEMTKVANAVAQLLTAKGYRVVVAERERSIYERPDDANAMGADVYVPIHSNAGGGVGTMVFYRKDRESSVQLSRYLFDQLAALTNTPFDTDHYKEDLVSLGPNGRPFNELNEPTMAVAYLEVEFHDIPEKAVWITQNIDNLAQAIANGIVAYCENGVNNHENSN